MKPMRIDPGVNALSFAAAARGSVLLTTMRGQKVVKGLKATYVDPEGVESDFFVTVGPFFDEHGLRPIVYLLDDIATDLVVDATAQTRLTYSLEAEAISMKKLGEGADPIAAGELLLTGSNALLAVANFGHAGPADLTFLDLESGILCDLPDMPFCYSLSKWSVETLGSDGSVADTHEFSVSVS
jgi:hypothetical protein